MNLSSRRLFSLPTLVSLFGSLLLGAWFMSTAGRDARPGEASGTPSAVQLSSDRFSSSDEEDDRAEIRALFRAARQQARDARKAPDLASLLALADQPEELSKVMQPLSNAACRQIILQLKDKPAEDTRNSVLRSALLLLGSRAPDEALALLAMLPDARAYSPSSPESSSYFFRRDLINDLLKQWIDVAPEAMARWMIQQNDQDDQFSHPGRIAWAIEKWGASQPLAAAEFTGNFVTGAKVPEEICTVLRDLCLNWSGHDPQGAAAWAKSLPETDPRKPYAIRGMLVGLTDHAPVEAAAYVEQQIGSNKDAAEFAKAVAVTWVSRDPEAALHWAFSLPDLPTRREVVAQTVYSYASSSIQPSLLQWAEKLPENEARGTAWGQIAAAWSSNMSASAEWLRSLPAGPDRDQAMVIRDEKIGYLANLYAYQNPPEQSLQYVQFISDPARARHTLQALLWEWGRKDRTAAADWAAAHNLPMPDVTAGTPWSQSP